jgi:hypothetical protein
MVEIGLASTWQRPPVRPNNQAFMADFHRFVRIRQLEPGLKHISRQALASGPAKFFVVFCKFDSTGKVTLADIPGNKSH